MSATANYPAPGDRSLPKHGSLWNPLTFLSTYVFSTDHKVIGLQFLFSTLIWLIVGGLLALAIRWQLAWPWQDMPVVGPALFSSTGGQINGNFYSFLVTMHGSIMVFFVVIPILGGAFGNFLIPLMIGAEDMAFPRLNMLSYWFMWPAFLFMCAGVLVGAGPIAGWTSYPPLAETDFAQVFWLASVICVGISSMLGSINYMTTIIMMRAPGMTMFRMPLTIWAMFITAILQAFALPVLTAALFMQLSDVLLHTSFFYPEGLVINGEPLGAGGGHPLLWQHLFWFYSHPAVYIMLLPAMGMMSDIISTNARKPIFGYRPMVFALVAIAGLGFIVWGHHMFVSGMSPLLEVSFMLSTMLIAVPSAIKVFNWLGTIWGGRLRLNTAMLFALAFVSMFIIGGLSGIFMASTPVDRPIHDTYFIVAHFHYVLFGGSIFGVFAGLYYWFPKMFGRMMNEPLGKIHFLLTFLTFNAVFYPMHILGLRGMPRRYADINHIGELAHLQPMNEMITYAAIAMGVVQIIFFVNFFGSLLFGPRAGRNPWDACSLEWTAASPPPHLNWDFQPIVHRGPYEYNCPGIEGDFLPQTEPGHTQLDDHAAHVSAESKHEGGHS